MNKCLNCGKECNNKYCSISCQNIHSKIIGEEKYNLNPKYCNNCGKPLDYSHRNNKFCSQSCSASFNNKGVCRNEKKTRNDRKTSKSKRKKIESKYNLITNEEFLLIIKNSDNWKDVSLKLGYRNGISSEIKSKIIEKAKNLDIELNYSREFIKDKTKDEIFNLSKNWQTGRSVIRKDASKVFNEYNKEYKCAICGYDKHVDIAHIKAVSEFDGISLLDEINNINNLIALCPNHHWEYDHGLLDIKNIK